MNSLADFLWAMIAFYFLFMCIWIFIRIFGDIFRRGDMSGGAKVLWILVLFWIPFFGAMIYLIARPKDMPSELFAAPGQPQPPSQPFSASAADEVAKLAALRDAGTITEAEFETAKTRALG